MKNTIFILFIFCVCGFANAQLSATHQVKKGETITQIAEKYYLSAEALYKLNPDARKGISENQTLVVPNRTQFEYHKVLSKETAFGISKQYGISLDTFYVWNPDVKESGLKLGQHVAVKKKNDSISIASTHKEEVSEKKATGIKTQLIMVAPGETIYSIAVNNKTTVSKIYELNPEVEKNGLKVNQELLIPATEIKERSSEEKESRVTNTTQATRAAKTIIVQPKETLYNISKAYNVSVEELNQWNPQLKEGLQPGMELIVGYPSLKKFDLVRDANEKPAVKHSSISSKFQKELILLLPFNIDKINLNDKAALNQKLNNDVFLNMTLDFYSGALIAIEQAGQKNKPLSVKIFDSKESNRSMDVNALKSQFDFSNAHVIIGPFFQKNVDAISQAFEGLDTWIVSPLSTEKGKPFSNQVHTMPSADILAREMIEFLVSKNQNIVGISNYNGTKSYDIQKHNEVQMVNANAKGKFTKEVITDRLMSDEKNYVILDTNNLETAIEVINHLLSLQKQYDIQLVSIDKNDVFDSSEIAIKDLANLQLLYPSVTNDTDNAISDSFRLRYNERFGSNPNRFAVRGFDVTHDVISRMFGGDDAEPFKYESEQVENKFRFVTENGGIYNQAVYFLQYNKDLTLKSVK